MLVWFLVSSLLSSSTAFSLETLAKDDFAYGNRVRVNDAKGIVQIALPEDLYLSVQSSALGDVGVFNEKDELVPHALVQQRATWIEKNSPALDMTLFPIFGTKNETEKFANISVTTSDGSIVNIEQAGAREHNDKIVGYLIDASRIHKNTDDRAQQRIDRIKVSLGENTANRFTKMTLEGCDDLKSWSLVQPAAVVGRFVVGSETLVKDEISLSGLPFRYYRISWPLGEDITLGGVKAIFSVMHEREKEEFLWRDVEGRSQESSDTTTEVAGSKLIYQFDAGGNFPVSGVRVKFTEPNSVARVLIENATSKSGPWRFIQDATFFTTTKDGSIVSNLESMFPERTGRFWRMVLTSHPSGVGSQFPSVSIAWRPGFLRFLRRGDGPFTLAYGSARVSNSPQPGLLASLGTEEVAMATLGEKITIGGVERLTPQKESSFSWNKVLLWVLLAGAVIFVAWMAIKVKNEVLPDRG